MTPATRWLWRSAALTGLVLALWMGAVLALVASTLTPEQRAAVAQLLLPRIPLLVLGWAAAVAVAAGLFHRLVLGHVLAPARLAERARVLLDAAAVMPREPGGPAPVAALEDVILALARQRDTLREDMAREVERATREIDAERQQLVALLAGMGEAVVVCGMDGRIALYNARARLQFQTLPSAGGDAGGGIIGVGRPVFDVLRREHVEHALAEVRQRLARGAGSASAQFVTVTRAGQMLRVTVTPVPGPHPQAREELRGFVLTLVNLTRIHDEALRRGQALMALHDRMRLSVQGLGMTAATLEDDAAGAQARGRAVNSLRMGLQSIEQLLAALAREATLAGQTCWPLQDVPADDLLAAAQARVQAQCGRPVVLESVAEGLWLRADSYALLQALSHLARRVVESVDVRFMALRLSADHGQARLDLAWQGNALSTETAMAWQLDPMELSGESTALSVRDVVARHGGDLDFVRDRPRHEACLRWTLPLGVPHGPGGADGMAAQHDLSLLRAATTQLPLLEQPLSGLSCTVFDTEATGLDPSGGDQVIQLGAVRIVNGRLVPHEQMDQLVDPGRAIPAASVAIHGITQDMVSGQPAITQVLPAFHAFARGTVLVAHNAAFDMKLLQLQEAATGLRFDQPVLDTLLLSAVAQPHQDSHTLDAIAQRLGIAVHGRHNALGDALTTAQIFLRLVPLLQARGIQTLGQALQASRRAPHARVSY